MYHQWINVNSNRTKKKWRVEKSQAFWILGRLKELSAIRDLPNVWRFCCVCGQMLQTTTFPYEKMQWRKQMIKLKIKLKNDESFFIWILCSGLLLRFVDDTVQLIQDNSFQFNFFILLLMTSYSVSMYFSY